MKPIRFIPDDTKIPFMKFSRFGFFVSGILCAASILLLAFVGLNMGVDFKGGTVITIRTEQPADLDALRSTINGLELGSAELQEFGSPNDVLIRIGTQEGGDEAQQAAVNKIKAALGPGVEYRSVDVVGPKVSGELTQQGILAVVIALVLRADLRLVPVRVAIRAGCHRLTDARRDPDDRSLLSSGAGIQSLDHRRHSHDHRLLAERYRRHLRPHP